MESGFGRDSPRPLSPPAPEREHVVRSLPWTPKVLCNKKESQVSILVLVFQNSGFGEKFKVFSSKYAVPYIPSLTSYINIRIQSGS